jgi:hypothetical protein
MFTLCTCISTGAVKILGESVIGVDLEDPIRIIITRFVNLKGWDILTMAHAIWFLGRHLWTDCGKSTLSQDLCPVFAECGGRLSAKTYFKGGKWEKINFLRNRASDKQPSLGMNSVQDFIASLEIL